MNITISWGRIAWQMARHLCGPRRATEHELTDRYNRMLHRRRAQLAEQRETKRQTAEWVERARAKREACTGHVWVAIPDPGGYVGDECLYCQTVKRA